LEDNYNKGKDKKSSKLSCKQFLNVVKSIDVSLGGDEVEIESNLGKCCDFDRNRKMEIMNISVGDVHKVDNEKEGMIGSESQGDKGESDQRGTSDREVSENEGWTKVSKWGKHPNKKGRK
jgi:hypothetical protein